MSVVSECGLVKLNAFLSTYPRMRHLLAYVTMSQWYVTSDPLVADVATVVCMSFRPTGFSDGTVNEGWLTVAVVTNVYVQCREVANLLRCEVGRTSVSLYSVRYCTYVNCMCVC